MVCQLAACTPLSRRRRLSTYIVLESACVPEDGPRIEDAAAVFVTTANKLEPIVKIVSHVWYDADREMRQLT